MVRGLFNATLLLLMAAVGSFARSKGRSDWFALLGAFNVIGLIAVMAAKKQCRRCGHRGVWNANACVECGAPLSLRWKPPPQYVGEETGQVDSDPPVCGDQPGLLSEGVPQVTEVAQETHHPTKDLPTRPGGPTRAVAGHSSAAPRRQTRARKMYDAGRPEATEAARVEPWEAQAIHLRIRTLNYVSLCVGTLGLALEAYAYRLNQAEWMPAREGADSIFTAGTVVFMVGLGIYARMKGRNMLFGLFGLLSVIGLVGLLFQQSRCHHCKRMNAWNTRECPGCGAPTALGWKSPPEQAEPT